MPTSFHENNYMSNINKKANAKNPGASPAEQEKLACPRCESTNTKFCYYNNYNFSQPRHFCKACHRYWTQGGTLRDIPVGGGTRKNAKRCRILPSNSATATSSTMNMITTTTSGNAGSFHPDYPLHATPVLVPFQGSSANMNGIGGGFASLLSPQGHGSYAMGGFGLGLGSGFVGDVGFGGLGRGICGLAGVTDGGAAADNGGGGGIGNTWQFECAESASSFGTADCFSWPDLAISTPGNDL